jgi:hypothetical protein
MIWLQFNPGLNLGFLPGLLSEDDPRPVREQMADKYAYGGGWNPMQGFTLDQNTAALSYPGDPPMYPLATTVLRDEHLLLYPYDFLVVIQPDGSFEASRVD